MLEGFLFHLRAFIEIHFLTQVVSSASTGFFSKVLLCMSTVTRILPLLVTAVKQYEFETNLTNNISVSSVLD